MFELMSQSPLMCTFWDYAITFLPISQKASPSSAMNPFVCSDISFTHMMGTHRFPSAVSISHLHLFAAFHGKELLETYKLFALKLNLRSYKRST